MNNNLSKLEDVSIIVLGITGDLSNKKILPAIGQLSALIDSKVKLIGYSRSQPNIQKVEHALNQISQANLENIELITGEYIGNDNLVKIVDREIKEGKRVIIYLAIPPYLFHNILDKLCIFRSQPISIVIEKPFGQNLHEAKEIIKSTRECRLSENVIFFDHYMFKNGLHVNWNTIRNFFTDQKLKNIYIKALETVTVQGREGYYEAVGAIKDILPSHFYFLITTVYKNLQLTLDIEEISLKSVKLGQYREYLEEIKKDYSNTETYFFIEVIDQMNDILLTFESGKKLEKKETSVSINTYQDAILYWQIDPQQYYVLQNKDKKDYIEIETRIAKEHTTLFINLISNPNNTPSYFPNDIINGWRLYDKVYEFTKQNNLQITYY